MRESSASFFSSVDRFFLIAPSSSFSECALALVGLVDVAVEQHHVETGLGGDVSDACTHETGAEDADLLHVGLRHIRTARALVQILHGHEQGADHRLGFRRGQRVGEIAAFHFQRPVDGQLDAFIDAAHDVERVGIIAIGVLAQDGVARRQHLHAHGRPQVQRCLETFLVPGLGGFQPVADELLGFLHDFAFGHHFGDEAELLGLCRTNVLALQQHLHRTLRVDHADDALGATAAGQQADLHFRQANGTVVGVGNDPRVASQRDFKAPTERHAVDGSDPRLAAGFQIAKVEVERHRILEQRFGGGFGIVGFLLGIGVEQLFQHGKIRAGPEGLLAGAQNRTLDGIVRLDGLDDGSEFLAHRAVDDVHRPARHVPCDEGDAVGIGFDGEVGVIGHDGSLR